jgi:AraC-like DNA-binding protein
MMRCDPEATPGQFLPHCPRPTSAPRARDIYGFGGLVQQIVTRLLPDGYPNVQSVAEMVRVSARTLQRRLAEEGLTFAGVLARARFDVAQRMLEDPARKVIDVALDLGYSDHAHFTRAFVRWTGLAPREFRRLVRPVLRREQVELAMTTQSPKFAPGANGVDTKIVSRCG